MSRVSPWKVVLVVEDDTDGRVFDHYVQTTGLPVTVDWVAARGIGEIKRRGPRLIEQAKKRVQDARGCAAVLIDHDGEEPERAALRREITRHCQAAGVPMIVAKPCMEAWFLADGGIANWLELRSPRDADGAPNPKDTVSRAFYRKTKRHYKKRAARPKVVDHADGTGAGRSTSLKKALELLDHSPCKG